jgi:hypothetical protein
MIGSGTAEDPWQIWSAQEFFDIRYILDEYHDIYGYFIQMIDIDCNDLWGIQINPDLTDIIQDAYYNWLPLGNRYLDPDGEYKYFNGNYDGNGFSVSNMTMYLPAYGYMGMFGLAFGEQDDGYPSYIKNVTLINPNITGMGQVAGIVGIDTTHLINCKVIGGEIWGSEEVGGISGEHDGGIISRCSSSANIFAGYNDYYYDDDYGYWEHFLDVYAFNVGGVVGLLQNDEEGIDRSFSTGNIQCRGTPPTDPTWDRTGYLAGIGGCIGALWQSRGLITPTRNCYAMGNITCEGATREGIPAGDSGWAIGGFVGEVWTSDDYPDGGIEIANCYSKGLIVGGLFSRGGFCGEDYWNSLDSPYNRNDYTHPTYESCYYDYQTSGKNDTDKGIPKTTIQMKTKATFIDWDFNITPIWFIDTFRNEGYPCFEGAFTCLSFTL